MAWLAPVSPKTNVPIHVASPGHGPSGAFSFHPLVAQRRKKAAEGIDSLRKERLLEDLAEDTAHKIGVCLCLQMDTTADRAV